MKSRLHSLWPIALALLLVAGFAVFGPRGGTVHAQASGSGAAAPSTITVSGTGSATVTPDRAQLNLGVTARAATAQTALANDSAKMKAVVAAIEGQGVAQADLRTTGLSLSPTYSRGGSGTSPRITGFQASNEVDVTLNATSTVGAVIDAALSAGANRLGGVSFTASQPQAAYATAYKAAMADARAAAQALAGAAGLSLTGIRSVVANPGGGVVVPFAEVNASAAGAVPPPVFGGRQTVTVTLRVVYNVGA